MGNIVNRVFDSSGPEGKVRGTPQQIIDKYTQLARDATLGNDRVAAENFQQHAEHYTRMLGEAQREMDARREQQEAQQQAQRDRQQHGKGGSSGQSDTETATAGDDDAGSAQQDAGQPRASEDAAAVIDTGAPGEADAGLVETPENKAPKPRRRSSRKPKAQPADRENGQAASSDGATEAGASAPSGPDMTEAAE